MITSVHNPKIAAIRRLMTQPKKRQEERAFVVEGVRLVEEAQRSGWTARQVLFTDQLDERGQVLVGEFSAGGVPVEQVSEAVMRSASETETPQGLMVVIEMHSLPLPQMPDFLLVLDGVRDPGNLGTILRTAAAAGVQGVLLPPGNADCWSPKVVRAGMGAHFRLPLRQLSWEEIRQTLKQPGAKLKVYLADAGEGVAYYRADFRPPVAIIVGGEAAGAGDESATMADEKVHIPMPGGSESLNAAMAAGILLFEVVRQR